MFAIFFTLINYFRLLKVHLHKNENAASIIFYYYRHIFTFMEGLQKNLILVTDQQCAFLSDDPYLYD